MSENAVTKDQVVIAVNSYIADEKNLIKYPFFNDMLRRVQSQDGYADEKAEAIMSGCDRSQVILNDDGKEYFNHLVSQPPEPLEDQSFLAHLQKLCVDALSQFDLVMTNKVCLQLGLPVIGGSQEEIELFIAADAALDWLICNHINQLKAIRQSGNTATAQYDRLIHKLESYSKRRFSLDPQDKDALHLAIYNAQDYILLQSPGMQEDLEQVRRGQGRVLRPLPDESSDDNPEQ